MNILFKKENLKTTVLTILNLFLGVLFCVVQVRMYNFVESVLCMILLGIGVVCITVYALMGEDDKILKLLIYGILATATSVFMMIWHRFFGIVLSLVAGFGGVLMLVEAIKAKKKGQKLWVTDFVIGLIVSTMALVTIILSGTNTAKIILSIFFGLIFLIQGVYSLVQLIILCKKEKRAKNEIKTEEIEESQEKISKNTEK